MKFEDIEQKNLAFYVPRYEVKMGGKNILYQGVEISSITVNQTLDGPGDFSISINNPQMDWLDKPLFQLGKEVEIKMGYGSELMTTIIGEISAVEPSFGSGGLRQMEIRGYDLLKRLQRKGGEKFRSWENLPDFIIAGFIALEHGLMPTGIMPTFTIHPKVVQNGETDYDFLKKRAEEIGYEFFVQQRTLYFQKPKLNKTPVTTLILGKTLTSFVPELNLSNKPSQVTVRGWDPALRQEIIGIAKKGMELDVFANKKSASQIIENIFGQVERNIREPVYSRDEAEKRAQAALNSASDQLVTGNGECIGIPNIQTGRFLNLEGLGAQFSMNYYIQKVTHRIDTSGYKTNFSVKGNAI